jgi:hypothetical protein
LQYNVLSHKISVKKIVGIEAWKWNLETITYIGYPNTLDEEKNKSLLLYFP